MEQDLVTYLMLFELTQYQDQSSSTSHKHILAITCIRNIAPTEQTSRISVMSD